MLFNDYLDAEAAWEIIRKKARHYVTQLTGDVSVCDARCPETCLFFSTSVLWQTINVFRQETLKWLDFALFSVKRSHLQVAAQTSEKD